MHIYSLLSVLAGTCHALSLQFSRPQLVPRLAWVRHAPGQAEYVCTDVRRVYASFLQSLAPPPSDCLRGWGDWIGWSINLPGTPQ